MNIGFFGTGYVGLVTGACLAKKGHQVSFFDVATSKINQLNCGLIPIYEPGLDKIIDDAKQGKRIHFTLDYKSLISNNDILFIAVGTPSNPDGTANVQFVYDVAEQIGQYIQEEKLIVLKSTVPIGTTEKVYEIIARHLKQRNLDIDFDVCFNPEFLKEGSAIDDFMYPDRIIIGSNSLKSQQIMSECYHDFLATTELIFMTPRAAELTKYAANAMLATKISFINEIASFADHYQIDVLDVKKGIATDKRIGGHFLNPGCGYGGSCFPKDVMALMGMAEELGINANVLKAVHEVNQKQKKVLVNKVMSHFNDDVQGHTFAVWGLSFKPGTDDIREAPSLVIINELLKYGAKIQAFDPVANEQVKKQYSNEKNIKIVDSIEETLCGVSAVIICTEWELFKNTDLDCFFNHMKNPVVFDGRNLFDPGPLEKKNIQYYGIGRQNSVFCLSNKINVCDEEEVI